MSHLAADSLNIKPGDRMPDFSLPVQTGGGAGLADYAGRSALVLFYYPKANTPG